MSVAENTLGLFSSSLGSTEARQEFSRRLAEVASTAFAHNSALDQLQRSVEQSHSGGEAMSTYVREAEKLRQAFQESQRLFTAAEELSKLANSLKSVQQIQQIVEAQAFLKEAEKLSSYGQTMKAYEDSRKLLDLAETLKKLGKFPGI